MAANEIYQVTTFGRHTDEQAVDDVIVKEKCIPLQEEAYLKLSEGATTLIPMVHPPMDIIIFPIWILSHSIISMIHDFSFWYTQLNTTASLP